MAGDGETAVGLRPFMPFRALDPAQLDRRWIDRGFGIEAILFSAADLDGIDSVGRTLRSLPSETPRTVHFPMSGDYLADPAVRSGLLRTIEMAASIGAEGVIIHANQFVEVHDVPHTDFSEQRRRLVEFFKELDAGVLGDAGLWLGVENMPLMGDLGDDVDAAFVHPDDFADLPGEHVGVVLDTAHLVGAIETRQLAPADAAIYLPPGDLPTLDGFADLKHRICHLHFSAVQGLALPPRRSTAAGGGVPALGDERYSMVLRSVARPGLSVSLEVEEDDYCERVNLWRALAWLRHEGLVPDE
jgi:sugar phosphate isomerase/epimerase